MSTLGSIFSAMMAGIMAAIEGFGSWIGNLLRWLVSTFFKAFSSVGEALLSFLMGLFASFLDMIPGVDIDPSTISWFKTEIGKWNQLIPIYEAFTLIGIFWGFKILILALRWFMRTIYIMKALRP